jgi:hypothetical protein
MVIDKAIVLLQAAELAEKEFLLSEGAGQEFYCVLMHGKCLPVRNYAAAAGTFP